MDEVRLYEMYLNEAIEERKNELLNKNDNYKKLREKVKKILNDYPKLQLIFEDDDAFVLETDDCKKLQELAKVHIELCDLEEKEIFLLGGKEMFLYLKDVGLIKEK